MSRIIGYSDNANHLLKSRPKGYSDGTNHPVKERWVGGADGANHKVWSALSVGDTYALGGYNWTVININAVGQAMLLCQSYLGEMVWDTEGEPFWSTSTIRTYLNGTFYNTFSSADKSKIVSVIQSNYGDWGDNHGTSNSYVFLLSELEIQGGNRYGWDLGDTQMQLFVGKSNAERISIFGNQFTWLRSASDGIAKYLRTDGAIGSQTSISSIYTRPSILINP